MRPRILVTGANGFVGRHLMAAMRADRQEVRVLTRSISESSEWRDCVRLESPRDQRAIRAAVAGIETIVHLAGHAHARATKENSWQYYEANVEFTRGLLEQAVTAGVRRVVFASSTKVMGRYGGHPWTEAQSENPDDQYGRTKLEAEGIIREFSARGGIAAVVFRWPVIYGPGLKANMLRLFELVWREVPLPLGAVANARSLLYVGNAVDGIKRAMHLDRGHYLFFLDDGVPFSTPALITAIAAALGRRPRLVTVPVTALRTAAHFGDVVSHIVPFPWTSSMAERLIDSAVIDSSLFRKTTGFCPRWTTIAGLGLTGRWFRSLPGRHT